MWTVKVQTFWEKQYTVLTSGQNVSTERQALTLPKKNEDRAALSKALWTPTFLKGSRILGTELWTSRLPGGHCTTELYLLPYTTPTSTQRSPLDCREHPMVLGRRWYPKNDSLELGRAIIRQILLRGEAGAFCPRHSWESNRLVTIWRGPIRFSLWY